MQAAGFTNAPKRSNYDIVIIGGAMMGASLAWHLSCKLKFGGSVLVIERDPSYANCSTAHTNSCLRQQFSIPLNIKLSQATAEFIKNLHDEMGGDPRVPNLSIQNFGYMYLADTPSAADNLRANVAVQNATGAGTEVLDRDEIARKFPFYQLDDILIGSHNTQDEGYWDGGAVFDWFRRKSISAGVDYLVGEVVDIPLDQTAEQVQSVVLQNGQKIHCGAVVNAAGPRAGHVAKMAGIDLPVEPRKRYTWVFEAQSPLDIELPLTVDPSGVHLRQDGPKTYMAGSQGFEDPAVDPTDFSMDFSLWENHVWPIIATRIPQFERIRVITEWAGHYAFNTVDQNAILGPHNEVSNFFFMNGFSGHGLQHAVGVGRGLAELLTSGTYCSLDLSPFSFDRLLQGQPMREQAVI